MEAITSLKSDNVLYTRNTYSEGFRSLPKIVPPSGKKLLSKFFVVFFS